MGSRRFLLVTTVVLAFAGGCGSRGKSAPAAPTATPTPEATPLPPAPPVLSPPPPKSEAGRARSSGPSGLPAARLVEELQRALFLAGFEPGGVDGRLGPATRDALVAFQEARDLSATGEPDGTTLRALFGEVPVPGHAIERVRGEDAPVERMDVGQTGADTSPEPRWAQWLAILAFGAVLGSGLALLAFRR